MSEVWSGNFWSSMYTFAGFAMIRGTITVGLENSDLTEYDAPYSITYGGMFRNGMTVSGNVHVDGDYMSTTIEPHQKLTFEITDRSSNEIKGVYRSMTPSDTGSFQINRGQGVQIEEGCILMWRQFFWKHIMLPEAFFKIWRIRHSECPFEEYRCWHIPVHIRAHIR